MAKLVVIVEVFVAKRDPEYALPDQGGDRMLDEPWVSGVAETSREPANQIQSAIRGAQQQTATRSPCLPGKRPLQSIPSGAIFDPTWERVDMSDYNAAAIARLMGLAFVRPPKQKPDRPKASETPNIIFTTNSRIAFGDIAELGNRRVEIPPSPVHIELAVEAGLPRNSLKHVASAIAGNDASRISTLEWDIVPKTTLDRRKGFKLTLEESERTERIARLFVHASHALGTDTEAREFMTAPHSELDGRTPFDIGKTDLGARRVERLLNSLEYGLAI